MRVVPNKLIIPNNDIRLSWSVTISAESQQSHSPRFYQNLLSDFDFSTQKTLKTAQKVTSLHVNCKK